MSYTGHPQTYTRTPAITTKQLHSAGTGDYKQRKLTKATLDHYHIKLWHNETDGTLQSVAFPVTKNGKVTGYLLRNENFTNKSNKWSMTGEVGVDTELLGQSVCRPSPMKTLIICEAQIDCLSLYQTINQFNQINYDIVSIGYGTKNALDHIENNLPFVKAYHQVVTCFDGDRATHGERKRGIMRGEEATEKVHSCLITGGFVLPMPDGKDVNDFLIDDKVSELEELVKTGIRPYKNPAVHIGCSLSIDELLEPTEAGLSVQSFPKLMKRLGGFRKHELTVLLAPPKSGKTLVTRQLSLGFIQKLTQENKGARFFIASLEETNKRTVQNMCAMVGDMPAQVFREQPSLANPMHLHTVLRLLKDTVLFNHVEHKLTPENIITTLTYAHLSLGVNYFILDHLSYLIPSTKENERQRIDLLLNELGDFIRKYPVHIIAVTHITIDKVRLNTSKNASKNHRDDEHPSRPYWYNVIEYDARGSTAFSQVADNVIGINKCLNPDGSLNSTSLQLLLCREREQDDLGLCDRLTMGNGTGFLRCT